MTRNAPGERWYRRLLRLYPRDFRERFGGEMTRLYRDRRQHESVWSLWSSLLADLVRTAPSEHLSIFRHDLRHAWRTLWRTPAITATAVLTLAFGVGASTAIFSVVHAVLLRPLPYPEPDRLVELFEENFKTGAAFRASALNYLSWAERAQQFDAIATFQNAGATLTDDGTPELLSASRVTASLFRVLRLSPIVGRGFHPEDDQPTGPRVVVLSESLWRSRFGGDRQIVGRSITLDGERHEVVGVMPWAFREVGRAQIGATGGAQLFLPMRIVEAQENRGNHTLRVVGRLRPGVSLDHGRDEMRTIAAAMARDFPATNANWGVRIDPLSQTMLDPAVQRSLLLVFGAVAIVFLIACANVANLLLVRGTRRHAELTVRTALGAGRARLVRQLLTESACLAAISGIVGVLVAAVTHPLLRSLLPAGWPRLDEMQLDLNVLGLGLLVSIVSGLAFGILPAMRASRLDLSRSLTGVGRVTADLSRFGVRQMLIVAQVALATVLLVGGALLLQGFLRLQRVPLGFEPDGVLTARVMLPETRYADRALAGQFYERLLTLLDGSGQVQGTAVATSAPFGPGVRASFNPPDRGQPSGRAGTAAGTEHIVSGGYFRVLGVPLLAGRFFDQRDHRGSSPVAVVSQRLARMLWADANPLGQTLERGGQQYEVVGIVGDVRGSEGQGVRGGGPDRPAGAAVYFAATQLPQRSMTVLVLPKGDPASVIATIRASVQQLDALLPLQQPKLLRDWFADSVAPNRFTTSLAIAFGASALLLASVGIYGVLAYSVASRTKEIGVRMAMGATRGRVIGLVLKEGMAWAGTGVLLGLIGAYAAARFIATLLFEIPPRDPVTLATVACAVTLVALLACSIPALRAVRIDPTIAMRTE